MRLEPASALLAETDTERLLQNLRGLSGSAESALSRMQMVDDQQSDVQSTHDSESRPSSALVGSRPCSQVDYIESEVGSGSGEYPVTSRALLGRASGSVNPVEIQEDQENQDPRAENASVQLGVKSIPRFLTEADSCSS